MPILSRLRVFGGLSYRPQQAAPDRGETAAALGGTCAMIQRLNFGLTILAALVLFGFAPTALAAAPTSLDQTVSKRIEQEIRGRYSVPPQMTVTISGPSASDIPGFDKIVVTFGAGTKTTSHDFLVSKDRKTLAHLETMDISQDLMSQINTSGRPSRGSATAPALIVAFVDFQDPFSARMHATLFPDLFRDYATKIRIIYKDYPLTEIHPWAMHAAVDANCLLQESADSYWDFAEYVFQNQKAIGGDNLGPAVASLDTEALSVAGQRSLDVSRVRACVANGDETKIRASMHEGDLLGIDSTPTLFINGEKVVGAVPESELRAALDRNLKGP